MIRTRWYKKGKFELEEINFKVNIGDFVEVAGWDWDRRVYWPCVVTDIIDEDIIEVGEYLSYPFEDRRKENMEDVKILDESKQIERYNVLVNKTKGPFLSHKKWLDFVNSNKKFF